MNDIVRIKRFVSDVRLPAATRWGEQDKIAFVLIIDFTEMFTKQ